MHKLEINQVIGPVGAKVTTSGEGLQRILWVDERQDILVTIAIEPRLKAPRSFSYVSIKSMIETGDLELVRVRPRPFALRSSEDIPEQYKAIQKRAWDIIQPLVKDDAIPEIFDKGARATFVRLRAQELGIDPKRVRDLLYRYWAHGSTIAALLPFYDVCGPQGPVEARKQRPGTKKRGRRPDRLMSADTDVLGVSVADTRERLVAGITEFYRTGIPVSKAWQRTKTKYFNAGFIQKGALQVPIEPASHEAPSYLQFYRTVKELDLDLRLTKRNVDTSTWNLRMRGVLGSSRRKLFGPCARFEIDATLMDIYLVSVFNRAWIIGRPVLYVIVDVFSGMVVGFYLGLEGPSWEGARLALFNAFTDKVEFCKQFGVDITPEQWPCHHLPRYLLGDNGELCGLAADDLPRSLGIWPQNAAVRRGDWKPNVEQQFRLVNVDQVHFLPGAVRAREAEVGKRNYVLDACLTLPELTSILIRRFIKFNHSNFNETRLPEEMLGANLTDATPIGVWNWGLQNMTGATNVRSRHEVWTNLLPRATATIRPTGLVFERRHYTNPRLERGEWFARTRVKGRYEQVEIRHLPYAPSAIWIRNDEAGEWEACHLLDRDEQFQIARTEEVWDRLKMLNVASDKKAEETSSLNSLFAVETDAIVDAAKRQARDAQSGMKKSDVLKDLKSNRAFEKAGQRIDRAREEISSRTPANPSARQISNVVPFTRKSHGHDPLDDIWGVEP
ncbi:Mu transposase C-terminal domain-containing protein [Paraburkholderia sp. MMS20-SJTN17]|uniref:Mu transposase C-terminal domain-containing protein n=1 Tax=Paraburkholderia translucens TaxID=2886945 RepID=A0ABS8KBG7_9BURK|nr:Mu transposase C-terminal domain-containing protein [Paraburkholderia sp. MMS20-SJTN17]MCC8402055.1 Mu transposase C-terminal domain-containing protein [Paraburkholderia sp. MMS20-SJTN17]